MLEILKAILYGIVEGITEWLPISSTGHLILLKELLPLSVTDEFWTMFEVVIQLGAICAVIFLFFHKLNPFSPQKNCAGKTKDLGSVGPRSSSRDPSRRAGRSAGRLAGRPSV